MRTRLPWLGALALLSLISTGGPAPAAHAGPSCSPCFSDPLDIDNPYLPFVVHRIRVYEQTVGEDDLSVIDVFLPDVRTFTWNGRRVACRVLQEWELSPDGLIEISRNYFAQADDGTVWYFGETVDKYTDGAVTSHGGSWLVGGPRPGDPAETVTADAPTVYMPAAPRVGRTWKSEDLPEDGIEEFDKVLEIVRLRTPYGRFRRVLLVEERTPGVGYKWYAPGVGFVQQSDGAGEEVLSLDEIEDSDDADDMAEELDEIVEEILGGDDD